jgi:stage V sporulation protein AD
MGNILHLAHSARIISRASCVGYDEFRGPLGALFDFHDESDRFGAKTWEKAEGAMQGMALSLALKKGGVKESPSLLFAGDLQNQCMASAQGLLPFGIPFFGLYGACDCVGDFGGRPDGDGM